jgi:hypothetical protein
MKTAAVFVLALLLPGVSSVFAQDVPGATIVRASDLRLAPTQERELQAWLHDIRSYRDWYDRYRNRIARNLNGGIAKTRRQEPAFPAWLPAKCDVLANVVPTPAGLLADGCDWLAYSQSRFTVDPAQQQRLQAQAQNEQTPHSSFWKHVHLDAGWGALDYRTHTYGLVGVHLTLPEIGKRLQIFLPPGVMLVSIPDGRGGHQVQPAATVGVSIKMFRFQFPGDHPGTGYFNLAHAYVIDGSTGISMRSTVDLLGLSFSWGN